MKRAKGQWERSNMKIYWNDTLNCIPILSRRGELYICTKILKLKRLAHIEYTPKRNVENHIFHVEFLFLCIRCVSCSKFKVRIQAPYAVWQFVEFRFSGTNFTLWSPRTTWCFDWFTTLNYNTIANVYVFISVQ